MPSTHWTRAWLTAPLPRRQPSSPSIPDPLGHSIRHSRGKVFGVLLGTPTLRLRGDYLGSYRQWGSRSSLTTFVETRVGHGPGWVRRAVPTGPESRSGTSMGHYSDPYYYLCLVYCHLSCLHVDSRHSRISAAVGRDSRGRGWGAESVASISQVQGHWPSRWVPQWRLGDRHERRAVAYHAGLFTFQVSVNAARAGHPFAGAWARSGVALGAIVIQTATSYLDTTNPGDIRSMTSICTSGALLIIIMMIFRPAGLPAFASARSRVRCPEGGDGDPYRRGSDGRTP